MIECNLEIHEKFAGMLEPHRFKVLYGGRGGMKTTVIADLLLVLGARRKLRILCAREFQTSIRESVHETLKDEIQRIGLGHCYHVLEREIRGVNGTEFIFVGLRKHNVESIKSYKGFDIAWAEEAAVISEKSWRTLIPTIRKPGSEIWVSFNPDEESDPTYQNFVVNPPNDTLKIKTGWEDNSWLPDEIRADKDHLYAMDPDTADNVYGGNPKKISKAQILGGKWVVLPFEPGDERYGPWFGPYQGIDWGFAESPTVLIRCWVTGADRSPKRELWIEKEAYGVGIDNDELAEHFDQVPGARRYVTRADSVRPETIHHVQQHGYPRVVACEKWPGSVEDGIRHLRGYNRIIIHPDCPWACDQAKKYSYKVDPKSHDVLPIVVKKYDDIWDAVRYALGPIIQRDRKVTKGYESVQRRAMNRGAKVKRGGSGGQGFRKQRGSLL